MEIEPSAVDGAKSAVIYSLVARENTMDRAALQSFVNQVLKQVPATYNRTLLSAIQVEIFKTIFNFMPVKRKKEPIDSNLFPLKI